MLSSITIKNFKAIQSEKGLTLNKLASVNYLVGKNGCGKSSVLEMLEYLSSLKQVQLSYYLTGFLENCYVKMTYASFLTNPTNIFRDETGMIGNQKKITDRIAQIIKTFEQNKIYTDYIYLNTEKFTRIIGNKDIKYSIVNIEKLEDIINGYDNSFKSAGELFSHNAWHFTKQFREDIEKWFKSINPPVEGFVKINLVETQLKIPEISRTNQKIRNFIHKEILLKNGNFTISEKLIYLNQTDLVFENDVIVPIKSLSGGQQNLIKLYLQLENQIKVFTDTGSICFILLDEPETSLHPEIQKILPALFQKIASENKCQLFISTHSPFIISASAKKGDQKVYLIEGGTCKKQDGFEGYEVIEQSNKLLGCGFNDFHKDIVICEGKSSNSTSALDEMVYNIIFDKEKYLFVSAGGSTELDKNSKLVRKVVKSIFANKETIKFFLKDGDNKGSKQKTAESEGSKNLFEIETKFLNRYAIESYIYDPEVVHKAYPEINIEAYSKEYENWCIDVKKISSSETNIGKKFDHAKLLRLLIDKQISSNEIAEKLARVINSQDTPIIYKELHASIFSS